MSVFPQNMFRRKPVITEEQIQKAQLAIDRWVEIQKTMTTNGWKFITDDLSVEIGRADSLSGITPENLADRSGYCRGLKYFLARIQDYKRAAEASETILTLASEHQE